MNIKDIEDLIKRKLPDSKVIIKDVVGDNNHFSAEIVSKDFIGKSKLEQHKMVYSALSEELKEDLHALTIKTMEEKWQKISIP